MIILQKTTELCKSKVCYCVMFICCTAAMFQQGSGTSCGAGGTAAQTLTASFLSIIKTNAYLSVSVAVEQPV